MTNDDGGYKRSPCVVLCCIVLYLCNGMCVALEKGVPAVTNTDCDRSTGSGIITVVITVPFGFVKHLTYPRCTCLFLCLLL